MYSRIDGVRGERSTSLGEDMGLSTKMGQFFFVFTKIGKKNIY